MVYYDLSESTYDKKRQSLTSQASVGDRLFSFFIDYLVLSPVVSFLLFILCQQEITAWKISRASAETFPLFAFVAISGVFLFSFFQSCAIYFYGATIGQHFLKLKTEMDRTAGLVFLRIFIRQVGFWISPLLLGLPWLAILADPQQRTFYDRLADSRVVSLKTKSSYFTFEFEKKYWQALRATLSLFIFFLVAAMGWKYKNQINASAYTFKNLKDEGHFCKELADVPFDERLPSSIALNLVGGLTDECLDKEADFVLWKNPVAEMKSLAYYAKSLTQNNRKIEKDYWKQACLESPSALGCKIASSFQNKELKLLLARLNKTSESSLLESTLGYELSLILGESDLIGTHFTNLKNFDHFKPVKKYLVSEILNRYESKSDRFPASVEKEASDDFQYVRELLQEMD